MRLSAIGDVCHAAALVTRIRRHWPYAELTWVIGKIEYQLVKTIPDVRFIIFDKKKGKQAVRDLELSLAGENFDVLLMMQVAMRANLASRVIKAKQRIGFDWARSKELHWFFSNKRVAAHKHAHVLEGFMDFGDALGLPKQHKPLWYIPIKPADEQKAKALIDGLGNFVVISPAASKSERNWLAERYAQVADYISEKGVSVILCGGPGPVDRQLADDIMDKTPVISRDLTGRTSLQQLLVVLRHAAFVIAPDTGPAHMSTISGTPVIGLYAHSNPRRTGPYNDLGNVVSVYDSCIQEQKGKPWQELPWGTRAKGSDLMQKISVNDVVVQVDKLLTSTLK